MQKKKKGKKKYRYKNKNNSNPLFFLLASVIGFLLYRYNVSYRKIIICVIGILLIIIILALIYSYIKNHRYIQMKLHDIDKLSGIEFEEFLKSHFTKKGYSVQLTSTTGDFGADLIMKKGKTVIVVQAKRYKKNVSISAVQEIFSAKAYYNADRAIVVTNSYFTSSAKKLAEKCNVDLYDRDVLVKIFSLEGGSKKNEYKKY